MKSALTRVCNFSDGKEEIYSILNVLKDSMYSAIQKDDIVNHGNLMTDAVWEQGHSSRILNIAYCTKWSFICLTVGSPMCFV